MECDDVPASDVTLEVQPFKFEPIIRSQNDGTNDEDSDDRSRDSTQSPVVKWCFGLVLNENCKVHFVIH